MNNVSLIGRLATEPDLRYTAGANQTAVCRFTLAVDRPFDRENADFLRITCFGKTAENVNSYLTKGRQCGVTGSIRTGSYKNKNGETVYTTEISADRVDFLGTANQQNQNTKKTSQNGTQSLTGGNDVEIPDGFLAFEDDDEGIPF